MSRGCKSAQSVKHLLYKHEDAVYAPNPQKKKKNQIVSMCVLDRQRQENLWQFLDIYSNGTDPLQVYSEVLYHHQTGEATEEVIQRYVLFYTCTHHTHTHTLHILFSPIYPMLIFNRLKEFLFMCGKLYESIINPLKRTAVIFHYVSH